jgi:acetylornithine deacetylase/succinyl-diaminopimelate desuccinylase-like protein
MLMNSGVASGLRKVADPKAAQLLRAIAQYGDPGDDSMNEQRLVELACDLISIPSCSGQEHAAANWVELQFRRLGVPIIRRLSVPDAADTIVGRIDGTDPNREGLLLGFHIDIERPAADWKHDPFTPRRVGDRLIGAGAHDMKGGAAAILGAMEAFLQERPRPRAPLVIAATTDEIRWSRGAHALIESGLLRDCRYALIAEPSPPLTFHDGCRGRHILTMPYSESAERALRAAPLVQSGERVSLRRQADQLILNAYLLPNRDATHLLESVRSVVGNVALAIDPRPTPAPRSYQLPSDSPIVQALRNAIGSNARAELTQNVCDANHFYRAGIQAAIYGPAGGNTDQADEYVQIDSLCHVATVYQKVMRQLAGASDNVPV